MVTQDMRRVLVLDQARGLWGAQRYLLRLAPLLRDDGIELVLGSPSRLELHDAWQRAGFSTVDVDLPVERSMRTQGRPTVGGLAREAVTGLRTAALIARVIRDGDYDAVWANAHWVHAEAALAGRLSRTPVVVHLHEEAMPGVGRYLRAIAVLFASNAVAVSKTVQEGLPRPVRCRVCVIPNGVDTDAMAPASDRDAAVIGRLRASLGVAPDDVMALAATRLDPSKRIEDLLDAVRLLGDPRVHLVVAGITSGYPEYQRRMIAEVASGRTRRVTFCGNRDDMTDMFRASDLVIHAGTVEGMPLGLIEAQACGKPVIAYDVAGVPEAVLDGKTGLLSAPCDVVGLSKDLGRLAADPLVRSTMGAAARAHVLARHRITHQAAQNAEVLRKMCRLPRVYA